METDPFGTTIYTTGELAEAVGVQLRTHFDDPIMVQGEVSDLTRSNAGHVYFNLVEPAEPGHPTTARLPVVLFQSNKKVVNTVLRRAGVGRIQDGMALRIRTTVDFYAPRGSLTLPMSGVDPTYTLDCLSSERDQLIAKLQSEGLGRRNKLHVVPFLPSTVGLITSIGSAAYADFTQELNASGYGWNIVAIDTRVQGRSAERELAASVEMLAQHSNIELIALIRGGGSKGDLAAFDSERLARAIAASKHPVWCGIGHEIDTSIADLMAHSSFKTPTACAAALNERVASGLNRADHSWLKITQRTTEQIRSAERLIDRTSSASAQGIQRQIRHQTYRHNQRAIQLKHAATTSASTAVRRLRSTTDGMHRFSQQQIRHHQDLLHRNANELTRRSPAALEAAQTSLDRLADRATTADPAHMLARGWSITRTIDGRSVRSTTDVKADEQLHTTVSDGTIASRTDS